MARILCFLVSLLTSTLRSRLSLRLEVAALRHQLSVYRLKGQRPRIAPPDRLLWSILAKLWSQWRGALFFVQPRTVTLWQQKRFRDYWRALSQHSLLGRPQISPELRNLIKRMWSSNPTWGSPRMVGELRTGDPCREINRGEVQTAWGEIFLCDLADISRAALERTRRYRPLYRASSL